MFRYVEFPPPNAKSHDQQGTNSSSHPNPRSRPRTRKACERCRQMKIKCDGSVPCGHCSRSFHDDCTYAESQRKRKRVSTPRGGLENLENRLKAIEESCQRLSDARTPSTAVSPNTPAPPVTFSSPCNPDNGITSSSDSGPVGPDSALESRLNQGEARFVISSADYGFIERLKAELGDWPGTDFKRRLPLHERPIPKLFRRWDASIASTPLPPFKRAEQLVNLALDAHILHQVINRARFDWFFKLLFSLDRQDYGDEEKKHIPLIYALMALGCLFEERNDSSDEGANRMLTEGTQYFETCRNLVDLDDCNDLLTLQTIFYMNLFLLSSTRVWSNYTYLSHTLSLALRLNLHQSRDEDDASTVELKSRLFWSLKQLLTAVSAMSGFPRPIAEDDLDLPYPLGVEDSGLESIVLMGQPLGIGIANSLPGIPAYLKLHSTLDRVVKRLYPLNGTNQTRRDGARSHFVSSEAIATLEAELKSWADSLPSECRLGRSKHPPFLEKAKYELCLVFCHVQIFLYRPFLHYLVEKSNDGRSGKEFQIYASACINASRNVIHLVEDMQRNGLLFGAQWRLVYIVISSSLSLLYVVLGCRGSPTAQEVLVDLYIAKKMLTYLRPYSTAAQRAHIALTVLTTFFFNTPQSSQDISPVDCSEARHTPENPDCAYTAALAERVFDISSHKHETYALDIAHTTSENFHCTNTHRPTHPASVSAATPNNRDKSQHDSTSLPPHTDGSTVSEWRISDTPSLHGTATTDASSQQMGMIPENGVFTPEFQFGDNACYLEARPFNLLQNTETNDDQFLQLLGYDGIDLGGITDTFPGFGGLF